MSKPNIPQAVELGQAALLAVADDTSDMGEINALLRQIVDQQDIEILASCWVWSWSIAAGMCRVAGVDREQARTGDFGMVAIFDTEDARNHPVGYRAAALFLQAFFAGDAHGQVKVFNLVCQHRDERFIEGLIAYAADVLRECAEMRRQRRARLN